MAGPFAPAAGIPTESVVAVKIIEGKDVQIHKAGCRGNHPFARGVAERKTAESQQ